MTDKLHEQHLGACRTAFRESEASGKILLVGEDNPISDAPEDALFCYPKNCSGHRLQSKIFGVSKANYLSMWRTNLCVGGWSTKKASARAHELLWSNAPWRVVVLLGKKVCDVAASTHESKTYDMFTSLRLTIGTRWVFLPHPSGMNRVWSQYGVVDQARRLMRDVAPEIAWGERDHRCLSTNTTDDMMVLS